MLRSAIIIILIMQSPKLTASTLSISSISSDSLAPNSHLDQIKKEKKKLAILKEAVFSQRTKNTALEQQLHDNCDRLKKYQAEIRKKEEKNEALLLEIRSLNDALIVQRSQKQTIMNQIADKEEAKRGGKGKSGFGWGLFPK